MPVDEYWGRVTQDEEVGRVGLVDGEPPPWEVGPTEQEPWTGARRGVGDQDGDDYNGDNRTSVKGSVDNRILGTTDLSITDPVSEIAATER